MFSKILFLWLNPLLSLGNKRPLNPVDLPQLSYYLLYPLNISHCDRSEVVFDSVEANWEKTKKTKLELV